MLSAGGSVNLLLGQTQRPLSKLSLLVVAQLVVAGVWFAGGGGWSEGR